MELLMCGRGEKYGTILRKKSNQPPLHSSTREIFCAYVLMCVCVCEEERAGVEIETSL
jgi:hypothetical protein